MNSIEELEELRMLNGYGFVSDKIMAEALNAFSLKEAIWNHRMLDLADLVSGWSKDPSTKVGAVIANAENQIISTGYNGFPRGIKDDERLNDREVKYQMVIHAEMNAILFAQRSLVGCKLFTYPFLPCSVCASKVVQTGISKVVSFKTTCDRWVESVDLGKKIMTEAGISVIEYEEDADEI